MLPCKVESVHVDPLDPLTTEQSEYGPHVEVFFLKVIQKYVENVICKYF